MVGAFGLLTDGNPSHFPGDRLVEANLRLDIWDLLQRGALTEDALTELKWGEKGCQLARHGPNLIVDGSPVPIMWDEPMEGVGCPWFECPSCKRRCRHLYLRQLACRRCCWLDYSSRHLRRQTPGVGRIERLRRKLGDCDVRPFAPLPARRLGRSPAYHEKLVALIQAEERALLGHLQSVTHDLERRIRVRKSKGKW
jgi:hypothetical protein